MFDSTTAATFSWLTSSAFTEDQFDKLDFRGKELSNERGRGNSSTSQPVLSELFISVEPQTPLHTRSLCVLNESHTL